MSTEARIAARWRSAGHERTRRRETVQRRAFNSGQTSNFSHSFGGEWRTADGAMRFNLAMIRARSRELEQNSPVINGFLNALINNVLGPTGIHFQCKIRTSTLYGDAKSGQNDAQANDIVETFYKRLMHRDCYLVSGDMTKRLADEIKLRRMAIDGEVFIRTYAPFDNHCGMARQIIDADLCDVDYNVATTAGGNTIRMGIETNKFGKRVAYHFLKQAPNDYQYPHQPRERERVDANDIRHLFVPLRPGQTRGLPWTSCVLLSVKQLDAFLDAAVVNARIGANRNIFYTKEYPTGWTAEDGPNLTDEGAIIDDLREGESLELPYGVRPEMLDTRYPDGEIEAFTKNAMRFNSMGLGTSYMTLSGDLSEANFSSLRAGLNEERSGWARGQQMFIESDCIPDFERALSWGIATQRIKLPPGKEAKFNAPKFTGRRWPSVNPLQDATADVLNINNLLDSRSAVVERRGIDPEELLDQIKEDKDNADARELVPADDPNLAGEVLKASLTETIDATTGKK